MTTPTGTGAQIGLKSEATFGTAVTVDTFHGGFLSESLRQDILRIESNGLRAGRRTQSVWAPASVTIAGSVELELNNQPLATLLTHMFGSVVTTGAGPYTHTATPGALTGKSLTIQVGRPDEDGTAQPFTYAGCKLAGWTVSASVGELAMLTLDVVGRSETTATALAAASYSANESPFVFTQGSVTIGGTPVATVTDAELKCDTALRADRHRLGSALVREQLESGFRMFTGTIDTDFEDLTAYNRFVNGDEAALVLDFDNGTDSLTITCNVRFDGATPTVDGPDMLSQSLPFKCISVTSDAAAITAVLVNGESSAA